MKTSINHTAIPRRRRGIRKSRTVTIMFNGEERVMKIPCEHSVQALRQYARREQASVT